MWQPWASAVALRHKRIETRHWSTDYRGPIAIHASKCWSRDQRRIANELGMLKPVEADASPTWRLNNTVLPLGKVIAVAILTNCLPTEQLLREIDREEYVRGNYAPGRYGWILESIFALERPIDFKGKQSFFTVPDALLADQAPKLYFAL